MSGEDADAEDDLYLRMAREIVDTFRSFAGDTIALHAARRAPLAIDHEGEITDYYGRGEEAVRILVQQYEDMVGEEMAHLKARQAIRRIEGMEDCRMPDYLIDDEEDKSGDSLLEGLLSRFQAVLIAS